MNIEINENWTTLKFNDKYYEAVKKGVKTCTTRKDHKGVCRGDMIYLEFPIETIPAKVLMVERVRLNDIPDVYVEKEGYRDSSLLVAELKEIYPSLVCDEGLYSIVFKTYDFEGGHG